MRKWLRLVKWIRNHRKKGNCSFRVTTNSSMFVITVKGCEQSEESWKQNMLRIPFRGGDFRMENLEHEKKEKAEYDRLKLKFESKQ